MARASFPRDDCLMNIEEAIRQTGERLGSIREGYYLLSALLGLDMAALIAHPEREIEDQATFRQWLEERAGGKPLAYLTHCRPFWGRPFWVDERVLVPRPETELLVEEALQRIRTHWKGECMLADIGTGSGCIAITLALEAPAVRSIATDISVEALSVARRNASAHGVATRIDFRLGDLLEALPESVDLIVANLPYVPTRILQTEPSIAMEPRIALDGGENGEEVLHRLLEQVAALGQKPGCVLLEIDPGQIDLFARAGRLFPGARVSMARDLSGKPRVLCIDGLTPDND
jgi:release factor glutamine methyltransferase